MIFANNGLSSNFGYGDGDRHGDGGGGGTGFGDGSTNNGLTCSDDYGDGDDHGAGDGDGSQENGDEHGGYHLILACVDSTDLQAVLVNTVVRMECPR